jgi:ATP-dependent RNA helicase DHX29
MLPVSGYMEVILEALKEHQVVVISGNTGCGKGTQIPLFLLDDWLLNWDTANRRYVEIICMQPQQLSAIGVRERAKEQKKLATQLVNKYTWRARCHYQLGCCSV